MCLCALRAAMRLVFPNIFFFFLHIYFCLDLFGCRHCCRYNARLLNILLYYWSIIVCAECLHLCSIYDIYFVLALCFVFILCVCVFVVFFVFFCVFLCSERWVKITLRAQRHFRIVLCMLSVFITVRLLPLVLKDDAGGVPGVSGYLRRHPGLGRGGGHAGRPHPGGLELYRYLRPGE